MSRLKRSLAYVAPTAAVLAVLTIGVIAGRWVTLRSPAAWIAEHNSVFSTGEVFADESRIIVVIPPHVLRHVVVRRSDAARKNQPK